MVLKYTLLSFWQRLAYFNYTLPYRPKRATLLSSNTLKINLKKPCYDLIIYLPFSLSLDTKANVWVGLQTFKPEKNQCMNILPIVKKITNIIIKYR